jgi:PAS domain S-box-containing protein/putative nucleotidyltransferase with HDIG domain
VGTILKGSPTGIGLASNRVFQWVNDKLLNLTGYSREEFIGQNSRMLYPSEAEFERAADVYAQIVKNGWGEMDVQWQHKDGHLIEVYLRSEAVNSTDLSAGVIFTAMDITARKRAEVALVKSEAIMSTILKGSPSGIGLVVYRVFQWVNDKLLNLTGYTQEELIGQKSRMLYFSEAEYKRVGRVTFAQIQENGWAEVETQWRRKDGSRMEIYVSTVAVKPGDLSAGVVFTAMDITVRKRAEAALLESRRQWEEIFQAIGQPTLILDASHRILMANRATLSAVGMVNEEVLGKHCYEIFHPGAHQAPAGCPLEQLLASGNLEKMEMEMVALGGTFLVSCTPMQNPDGSLEKIIHIATDITAQKRAGEELRLAAHKWRTTFDAMRDAVCLLDREGVIVQCNQAMANLVEQSFPEILGHSCWEVICGTSAPTEDCPICRLRHSHIRETLTWKRGDRWWHVTMDPILTEAGEVVGGVHTIADITLRKLSQDKVQNLNILLRAIKDINESLLRVKSEKELFQRTCDLLLTVPYIRFCWIGRVEPDNFEVNPVAWAGAEEGYLSTIKVTWDDSELGQGPAGQGLKTGKPVLRRNIATDPAPNPWRQEALNRGYQSSISLPLIHEGLVVGILKVYSGVPDIFRDEEIDFLNQVAGDIAVGVKSLRLEQGLDQSLKQLQIMIHQTVETMASIVETRDPYTAGHQQGVAHLACAIAAEMGLDANRLQGLRVAGLLHDIGKMLVPAEILSKPGKLSEIEFNLIKVHSQVGADILGRIDFPWPAAQIVLQHHERLNGSGYPHGLAVDDIIMEARILAVADVVEAMSSYRPYRPALGIEKALEEITRNKGILYDSEVVDACITLFTEGKFIFEA